jgi:hypothetical protein
MSSKRFEGGMQVAGMCGFAPGGGYPCREALRAVLCLNGPAGDGVPPPPPTPFPCCRGSPTSCTRKQRTVVQQAYIEGGGACGWFGVRRQCCADPGLAVVLLQGGVCPSRGGRWGGGSPPPPACPHRGGHSSLCFPLGPHPVHFTLAQPLAPLPVTQTSPDRPPSPPSSPLAFAPVPTQRTKLDCLLCPPPMCAVPL